jgi:hypothetical protein
MSDAWIERPEAPWTYPRAEPARDAEPGGTAADEVRVASARAAAVGYGPRATAMAEATGWGSRPGDVAPRGISTAAPDVPPWAGRAVLVLSVFAGAVLVGTPLGIGLTVILLAMFAVAAAMPRPRAVPDVDLRVAEEPAARDRWTRAWWAFAAALALMPALRSSTWVVVPDVIVAVVFASVAIGGGRRWGELGASAATVGARLPLGVPLAGRAASVARGGVALRGLVIAAVLLAVFVPLLMSADAAFSELLGDAIPNLDRPVERGLVAVLFAAVGGALLFAPLPAPAARPPRRTLARLDWALPLTALVVLLGAFVVLQLATLFGGRSHVVDTAGLTYAEYARSGFAQLLAVAALTLGVVAAARRWARDGGTLLRVLLTALCLLTLVVLASALKRLGLYEEEYGFTRLRFAAHAILLWLGALFVLVLAARQSFVPRGAVAITAAAVLLFALADPDRRIVQHNLDRYEHTGKLDRDYLERLGG